MRLPDVSFQHAWLRGAQAMGVPAVDAHEQLAQLYQPLGLLHPVADVSEPSTIQPGCACLQPADLPYAAVHWAAQQHGILLPLAAGYCPCWRNIKCCDFLCRCPATT